MMAHALNRLSYATQSSRSDAIVCKGYPGQIYFTRECFLYLPLTQILTADVFRESFSMQQCW